LGTRIAQPIDKLFFILIVFEYLTTLDSPDDDVMQCTRCVKAGGSQHAVYLPANCKVVMIFIYLRTLYSKEEKVNTSTKSIEKNYYRVDKKTTS